ncbi:MAG: DUF89 family protein [Candidatus Heimdallarchaeota archaeon]
MPNSKCLGCLNEITERVINLSTTDKDLQRKLLSELKEHTKRNFDTLKLPDFSTEIFQIIEEKTGTEDPFLQIKIDSNNYFLELIPKIRESLIGLSINEKLRILIQYSIAANMVDFSTGGYTVDLAETARNLTDFPKEGLTIDDFDNLVSTIEKSSTIIYLSDNCGEVVVDNLVVEFLVKEMKKEVYFGLKGSPVSNDCTLEDFKRDGLTEYATETFIVSSSFGWNLHQTSEQFNELIRKADLLIVKGQSNYETTLNNLMRYPTFKFPPIFSILRTKCEVITANLGVTLSSNVVKQMYPMSEEQRKSLKEIVD